MNNIKVSYSCPECRLVDDHSYLAGDVEIKGSNVYAVLKCGSCECEVTLDTSVLMYEDDIEDAWDTTKHGVRWAEIQRNIIKQARKRFWKQVNEWRELRKNDPREYCKALNARKSRKRMSRMFSLSNSWAERELRRHALPMTTLDKYVTFKRPINIGV